MNPFHGALRDISLPRAPWSAGQCDRRGHRLCMMVSDRAVVQKLCCASEDLPLTRPLPLTCLTNVSLICFAQSDGRYYAILLNTYSLPNLPRETVQTLRRPGHQGLDVGLSFQSRGASCFATWRCAHITAYNYRYLLYHKMAIVA
jgi:hypothetical protein